MIKRILRAILFNLVCFSGFGQDTTVVLSKKMFAPDERLVISSMHGWVFKSGNNVDWSKKNLNTSDWQHFRPADIAARYADSTGLVEGWFRLRVKLDSTFLHFPLSLSKETWAAMDVYLDGQLIHSYGNTGRDGKPFQEHNPYYVLPVPVHIQPQQAHLIAIHIVDETSQLQPLLLPSLPRSGQLLSLTGAQYTTSMHQRAENNAVYTATWLFVSLLIALLLWLLSLLNLYEKKIIHLIAIVQSLISVEMLARFLLNFSLSHQELVVNALVLSLTAWASNGFAIVALMTVLRIKISRGWSFFIIGIHALGGFLNVYVFDGLLIDYYLPIQFCIFIALILLGRDHIKGASRALIVGVIVASCFAILMAFFDYNNTPYNYNLLLTGIRISFPISLVVYVSLLMKELLIDIQEQANKLVKVSEEKKQLLANQNILLEQQVQQRTAELRASQEDLEKTLNHLKNAQEELIRQEKLASVGQLTKGIVDRLLNPLNYINNFSESSSLLVDELNEMLEKHKDSVPESIKEEFLSVVDLIKSSVIKIYEHGATTTRIVKDMQKLLKEKSKNFLQTDLNVFVENEAKSVYDEIKVNYPDFTVQLILDLVKQPLETKILPPEFGEVIVAIIDNSFYALADRRETDKLFSPQIKISTELVNDEIILKIKDNGTGVSPRDLERLCNPFFTTKPTSKGTGLGLFMSKDIIEIHKGEIKIDSEEGESTEVIMVLPTLNKLLSEV